jgi:hypothetical protein
MLMEPDGRAIKKLKNIGAITIRRPDLQAQPKTKILLIIGYKLLQ